MAFPFDRFGTFSDLEGETNQFIAWRRGSVNIVTKLSSSCSKWKDDYYGKQKSRGRGHCCTRNRNEFIDHLTRFIFRSVP